MNLSLDTMNEIRFKKITRRDDFAAVMETFEVLVQVYSPGVMDAGLTDGIFWLGMLLGLIAGFIAAFPVNYIFIKRGYRHQH